MIYIVKYTETRTLEVRFEVRGEESPEEIAAQVVDKSWHNRRVLCPYNANDQDFVRTVESVRLGSEADQELGDRWR